MSARALPPHGAPCALCGDYLSMRDAAERNRATAHRARCAEFAARGELERVPTLADLQRLADDAGVTSEQYKRALSAAARNRAYIRRASLSRMGTK